jgi:AAA15 family ATPase/GTPase
VSKIGGVIFISSSCNFQQSFNSTFAYLLRYKKDIWKKYLKNFLQKIYPDLNDIIFIDSRIMVETQEKTLPLSYLGDAFKKAFYLLLAIYHCEGGVLLIDEFENGIHYENQQIIWDMLLSASKEFNVQLFISTHSYEMLEYLQKAIENQPQEDKTHWQEQLSLFSFVKLNKTPSSYYHDYDSFNELVKSKWELR